MTLTDVLTSVGVSGAAALLTAWATLKFFGKKIAEAYFAERLEAVKLEGTKQIERLKFERSDILDRAAKLNQREFEIVPQVWKSVNRTHSLLTRLVHQDNWIGIIGEMSDSDFRSFLNELGVSDDLQETLMRLGKGERELLWASRRRSIMVGLAKSSAAALSNQLDEVGIFLHPATHKKFNEFMVEMIMTMKAAGEQIEADLKQKAPGAISDESDLEQQYRLTGADRWKSLAKYLRERYWINADGEAI